MLVYDPQRLRASCGSEIDTEPLGGGEQVIVAHITCMPSVYSLSPRPGLNLNQAGFTKFLDQLIKTEAKTFYRRNRILPFSY